MSAAALGGRHRWAAGALIALASLFAAAQMQAHESAHATASTNAAAIRAAFAAWRDGTGSVFDLLADEVEWTVAGSSPVSGVYSSRQAFLDQAVRPISARLSTPIIPEVRHVIAQGNDVVVVWQGRATARDGSAYHNDYVWHLVMEEGRVVRATAFLDTWALDRLMR